MGKQVKGWTPPDEDLIVDDKPAKTSTTSQWTPPATDAVEGPKKKRRVRLTIFQRFVRAWKAFKTEFAKEYIYK